MVRRATFTATQSSRAAGRLLAMFAAFAAVLFLVSFAGVAMAMESVPGSADTLYGKIAAIDTSHPTGTLTLQSPVTGEQALNIFVNDDTAVKMCDADKSLKDIRIGSNAQVTYYELAGMAVADFIYVPC